MTTLYRQHNFGNPITTDTINVRHPLSWGLGLAVCVKERNNSRALYEAVTGQVTNVPSQAFSWIDPTTYPMSSWIGPAAQFLATGGPNGTGAPIAVLNQHPLFRAAPTNGYSFACLFQPTSSAQNGIRRIMDTSSIAGFVTYQNLLGAGQITNSPRDGSNVAQNQTFSYPTSPLPWLMVCCTYAQNGDFTQYANVRGGVLINGMAVQNTFAANLANSWGTGGAPVSISFAGTFLADGVTEAGSVPPMNLRGLWAWQNRTLSSSEINNTLYPDPFGMFQADVYFKVASAAPIPLFTGGNAPVPTKGYSIIST